MKTKKKIRMGRPPMPAGQAKTVKVFFRAEPTLFEKLEAAAQRAGQPIGTWIHDQLKALVGGQ